MQDARGKVAISGQFVPWRTQFESDLRRMYSDELRLRHHEPRPDLEIDELAYLVHEWRRRRLEDVVGRRLAVHYSMELLARPCPPAVSRIARLAAAGEPLWPHTSERTRKPRKHDDLLNHWGVVHFHLGDEGWKNGYVSRTNDLLFARVADGSLYLIGIFDHQAFQSGEIVNIAIRNWPASFEPYRLRGLAATGTPPTPAFVASGRLKHASRTVLTHPTRPVSPRRLQELREQGLNATFEAESGALYYPPGGGYSCARTSVLSRVKADHELWWAQQLCNTIESALSDIVAALIAHERIHNAREFMFRLESFEAMKAGHVLEEATSTRLELPMKFDYGFDAAAFLRCMSAGALASSPHVRHSEDSDDRDGSGGA